VDRRFLTRALSPLVLLLLVAAALRLGALDWDGGIGAHPDERHIVGVAESLQWPGALNPFEVDSSFAYGHLPLYLLALAHGLGGGAHALEVGRILAALFDVGTVVLTFALGRRAYGTRTGLLAAAFITLAVHHIQQAHFYTVDVPLTFFALGALLSAVRLADAGRTSDAWQAGAWAGLALGTKSSALLLALPLAVACAAAPMVRRERWRRAVQSGAAALLAFALTNPSAILAFPISWSILLEQAAVARGSLDVPYTRQFHATWPYAYQVLQLLRWGIGWLPGLTALGGLAYAVWRTLRYAPRRAEWVLLAWTIPYFAFVGALYAKFPRYMLPLTPLLLVYGARLVVGREGARGFSDRPQEERAQPRSNLPPGDRNPTRIATWRGFIAVPLLAFALIRCLAFLELYASPHPWLAASNWLQDDAKPGAVLAVEAWDHPLPVGAVSADVRELPVFDEDTPEKWRGIAAVLAEADYVIIATRRGYATLAAWPQRYPLATEYYRLLFAGALGFEPVACFGRHPRLGALVLADDPARGLGFSLPAVCQSQGITLNLGRLDESSAVYDHPRTIVFKRDPEAPRPADLVRLLTGISSHE
jgi:4-amino-4-deoxy-L-arabinose transferase-like glycosyltransferase